MLMNKAAVAAVALLTAVGVATAGGIVIPSNLKPFEASKGDVIHIKHALKPNWTLKAKVTVGKAELEERTVTTKRGKMVLQTEQIIEIRPKEVGKYEVEFVSTSPSGEAVTDTYQFEVK